MNPWAKEEISQSSSTARKWSRAYSGGMAKALPVMKATKVDGVYDSDPKKNPDAKRYDRVSYMEVLSKRLNVMDSTATSLCMDNDVPMIVFDLTVKGNISRALKGEDVGTTVESQ